MNSPATSPHPAPITARPWFIPSLLMGAGALFLMVLMLTVGGGPVGPDSSVLRYFVDHRGSPSIGIAKTVSWFASETVLPLIALIVAVVWWWRTRRWLDPALFFGSLVVAIVVSTVIKKVVGRARPPALDMIHPLEHGNSFPSNHTLGIAVFLLVGGYLLTRAAERAVIIGWLVITVLGTAAVAASRLCLGYHWFTDTLGSALLAVVLLGAVMLAGQRLTGLDLPRPTSRPTSRRAERSSESV